jgi:hypothetical protein
VFSYRFARASGVALTLLAGLFLAHSLWQLGVARLLSLPVDGLLAALALSTLFYTALLVGVTTGFAHLVQASGHGPVTPAAALVVWGKANLAKYLPGNVLHFAGRQFLGARQGWPQAAIATASLLEVCLFVLLPMGLAVLALATAGELGLMDVAGWHGTVAVATAGLLGVVVSGALVVRRLPAAVVTRLARLVPARPAEIAPACLYFLSFFLGMSLIAWALHGLVAGSMAIAQLPLLTGVFLVSWVTGFIVPGAPGGIGVREGSFALLGGVFLEQESLVVVALLLRFVTLAGEGLLFLLALRPVGGLAPATEGAPEGGRDGRQLSANRSTA